MSEDVYVIHDIMSERECVGLAMDILAHNWHFHKNDGNDTSYSPDEIGVARGLPLMPKRAYHLFDGLTDYVKQLVGNDNLRQSSIYGRVYRNGSQLYKHVDRSTLDWTITVPLFSSLQKKWPIYIQMPDGEVASHHNVVGTGPLFKARKLPHWRDKLECSEYEFSVHLFMHWEEMK